MRAATIRPKDAEPVIARTKKAGIPMIAARLARGML
jgi:hypothetical protein